MWLALVPAILSGAIPRAAAGALAKVVRHADRSGPQVGRRHPGMLGILGPSNTPEGDRLTGRAIIFN